MVLVVVVHQASRADDVGQSGGEEAIISVDDRQPLILQLNHRTRELKHVLHFMKRMILMNTTDL